MTKLIDADYFKSLVKPRPTGSKNNNEVIRQIKETAGQMGYRVEEIPFDCVVWEKGDSFLEMDGETIAIQSGPFSPAVQGNSEFCFIHNIEELRESNITDKIVFLEGEIAQEPISPKDFPYYYPDNHKEINDLLEEKRPLAVIGVTGKHPMCGLEPYPLFEDGNFKVPSAFISKPVYDLIPKSVTGNIQIVSKKIESKSSQLIFRKPAIKATSETMIVCAHVDTAYHTPGALDNAVGLATMLQIMEHLKDTEVNYNFEFIPFNGEDYFDITGQRTYLEKYPLQGRDIKLVLNIDDAGHVGSYNALSTYNLDEKTEAIVAGLIADSEKTMPGKQWYESDHSMFVYSGIPAVVFASSDLLESTVRLTHTPDDTVDQVDFELIECMSECSVRLFEQLGYLVEVKQ